MQNILQEKRKFCLGNVSKGKIDHELIKQIERDNNNLMILSDHKIELVNELSYINSFNEKKLCEVIENCEKNISSLPIQSITEMKSIYDRNMLYDDGMSVTGSSKIYFKYLEKKSEHISSKSAKDISNVASHSIALLKRKKNRSKLKKQKEEEELASVVYDNSIYELDKVESEPTYCFCNGVSYGDMVLCEHEGVFS